MTNAFEGIYSINEIFDPKTPTITHLGM